MTDTLPDGWKEVRLGDVCDVIGGGTPKTSIPEYWEGDIPWLSPKDLSGYSFKYISKGHKNITNLGLSKSSSKILPKDSVLISSRAPIGYVAIAENDICTNQGFKSLILHENQKPQFYYYWVKANNGLLQSLGTGSTFKEISGSVIKSIKINIPPLGEQKRIADILSSLDDKIENSCKMNETLEQMAQAMFKSWFVDFDPVHALIAFNNGKSEFKTKADLAKSLYMNEETLNLFPDSLNDNGLPMGWEMKRFDEIFFYTMGQSPLGKTLNENNEGMVFFQGRAEFSWRFPKRRLYTTEPKRFAKKNDILFSVRAPVGDVNVAIENCCVGRGLCSISHKEKLNSYGLYLIKDISKSIKSTFDSGGTVFGSITKTDLAKWSLISPNIESCKKFNALIDGIDKMIFNNEQEIQTLTKTRDTLLPQLISGKVRV